MTHLNTHMSEPHLRWVVERRWKIDPPAPHTNNWELHSSHDELKYAQEARRDDMEDQPHFVFRIRDTLVVPPKRFRAERRLIAGPWTCDASFDTEDEAKRHIDMVSDYCDPGEKDYSYYSWRVTDTLAKETA